MGFEDMDTSRPASKVAEELLTRPDGATMDEIVAATGGPQYNVLRRLAGRGYRVRKLKQGRTTRYFAEPPAAPTFEATITHQGQVTIPKEIRERLRLRKGGRIAFAMESGDRVIMRPVAPRLCDLVGVLPRPKRAISLEEMDEAIKQAAVDRYLRAVSRRKR